MITKENLASVVGVLDHSDLEKVYYSSLDYVSLHLSIFNSGAFPTLESVDYDENDERGAHENGQIYCDRDSFFILLKEVGLDIDEIID